MSNKVGILGLGSKSTLFYLNELNEQYNLLKGGYSTFPCTMLNADFNTINPFLPKDFKQLVPIVENYLTKLTELGCEKILIPNITLHETIDKIKSIDNTVFIHPKTILNEFLSKNQFKKVLIVGTKYTMQSKYLNDAILKNKCEKITLSKKENASIDELRTFIYQGEQPSYLMHEVMYAIEDSDADLVVVACTELSLFFKTHTLRKEVLDLAQKQIQNAIHSV